MHELYELKDMLMDELKRYGAKKDMSTGTLDVVDKLSHTVKNLCKIIEDCENEEYSRSYAPRGRERYMGRYSRDNSDMIRELHELMENAPDEHTKQEFKRFIQKIEQS